MTFEIKKLDESYKGEELDFFYNSEFYYDIQKSYHEDSINFRFVKKHFSTPIEKRFKTILMEDHYDNPILYGVIYKEKVVAYLEMVYEKWNNRMRITNILVEHDFRNKGIGKLLMEKAYEVSKNHGARAIVVETQSCNFPAINFYKVLEFKIVGFDLQAYSNEDVDRLEVRVELGKSIK
ncbi:MAG: GNAT family N-acetyltransferase [Gudongella sp.]|nr:GNAT family N-acetyltransferase [Gudongella sp.]